MRAGRRGVVSVGGDGGVERVDVEGVLCGVGRGAEVEVGRGGGGRGGGGGGGGCGERVDVGWVGWWWRGVCGLRRVVERGVGEDEVGCGGGVVCVSGGGVCRLSGH